MMSSRTGRIPALSLSSRPVDKDLSGSLDCACHETEHAGPQQSRLHRPTDFIPLFRCPQAITPSCDPRNHSNYGWPFQLCGLYLSRQSGRRRHAGESRRGRAFRQFDEPCLRQHRHGEHRDAKRNGNKHGHCRGQYLVIYDRRSGVYRNRGKSCFFACDRAERNRSGPVRPECYGRSHGHFHHHQRRFEFSVGNLTEWYGNGKRRAVRQSGK